MQQDSPRHSKDSQRRSEESRRRSEESRRHSRRETKGYSCSHIDRSRAKSPTHSCIYLQERVTRLTSSDNEPYIHVIMDKRAWTSSCNSYPSVPVVVNNELQKQLKEACCTGKMDVIDRLIDMGADPHYCNPEGTVRPSVYYASRYGHIRLLRRLIEKHNCNVYYKTPRGTTLLHVACLHGHEHIVTYLTQQHRLDASAKTKLGSTPLHLACIGGHPCIVQFLIEDVHCDPKCSGELDETPLHTACTKGHLGIMKYLITVHHCNPCLPTRIGAETPLHLACQHGHLDIVAYLITVQHCDPNARDFFQNTPLHSAAQQNHPAIVRYLVLKHGCDPYARNRDNYTPLHLASKYSRLEVVRVFLEEANLDPSVTGPNNQTPIQVAYDHEVIKLLIRNGANPLEAQVQNMFPDTPRSQVEDTIIRAMIVGDPACGKSTLVEALKQSTKGMFWNHPFGPKSINVKPCTAGIIPHEITNSSEFGHVIFFDFAGHSEYYSSHAVVIDCTSISTAPIFVVVVDLSKEEEKIKLRLNFWVQFIENNKPSFVSVPHIVVVGSHYDILTRQDPRHREHKVDIVKRFAAEIIRKTSLEFRGFFPINCQKIGTHTDLRNALQKSCRSLRGHIQGDSLCHAFSVYLFAMFRGRLMCTVKEVAAVIRQSDSAFPFATDKLCHLCECLGSKVNIMFIKNTANLEESTIILEVNTLLSKIQAVMFAPKHFLEHQLESKNGIVTFSKLQRVFQDLNPRVITQCMQRLEFCHEVHDQGVLQLIKGSGKLLDSPQEEWIELDGRGKETVVRDPSMDEYYFFPCLVNVETPDRIWQQNHRFTYYTGWCLKCSEPLQYFDSRFLHAVLLRTAFRFAVQIEDPSDSQKVLKRECNPWKSGIHWFNLHGTESYIELREDGQVLVLVMRCFQGNEMECIKLRAAIINKISETKAAFAPKIKTEEGLLDPESLILYPIPSVKRCNIPFYSLPMILKPLMEGYSSTFDTSSQNTIKLCDLIFWDPYMHLGKVLLKELLDPTLQNNQISDNFIFDVSQREHFANDWEILGRTVFELDLTTMENICEQARRKPGEICRHILHNFKRQDSNPSYGRLREILDVFSIFYGRNLQELAGPRW